MLTNIQYLTDEQGERTAVVVDIKAWNDLQLELKILRQQNDLKTSLSTALQEVQDWKQGKKQLRTLEQFLADG